MGFTKEEVWRIAREQSAIDGNCDPEDFLKEEPVLTISHKHPKARVYLELPHCCNLVSYGTNVVASVSEELKMPVEQYLCRYSPEHCFETPNLHVLEEILNREGKKVCFMAEYFLPVPELLQPLNCGYHLKRMEPSEFQHLYLPEWSNALCEKRKERDVLAIGAFDGEKLIGLAGASADCDTMWQIGIDVQKEYRQKGIAASLTSHLALKIFREGKVPFYCAAWSNIRSVRNALRSGFRPGWVEVTAKPKEFVAKMND